MSDFDLEDALSVLGRDPLLAGLIGRHPAPGTLWPPPDRGSPFAAIVRAVLGQQVSVQAAAATEARLRALAPGLEPGELAPLSGEALRGAGLSWAKVRTVQALTERAGSGALDFRALRSAPDEAVVSALVEVPGIGRWTAEMFLMFALGRPDVFSWGDAGLRRAVWALYGQQAGPEVAEAWTPYRSVASRLLWFSLHNEPGESP